jgi:LmbE family N-acetylglucosaminyl deacetylase/glycosyltransferase involved in cell wall biosynthesis
VTPGDGEGGPGGVNSGGNGSHSTVDRSPQESELIPYATADLTGARILALAAHPDDESFGAGGVLAANAGRAEAIRVWIATDGTGQEGVPPEEAAAYGARRREEAGRALEALGLEAAPRFGGFADRSLEESGAALDAAIRAELDAFRPDLVLCPSPVEIHPDHRALARSLFGIVAASRAGDPDHDRFRFLRMAFYELSHPLLPNALVDIAAVAARKDHALRAHASQQSVRDYAGAIRGLNAYRRLTLPGSGPVEAFRVVTYAEAAASSFEDFRRSIGPAAITGGLREPAPVSIVIRTRNRPALLREALESLRAQTARPAQVVVVNDGGASPRDVTDAFRDAFDLVLEDPRQRRGRSAAANRGVTLCRQSLVAFLDDDDRAFPDHLDRLVGAQREGPEPVVYSDAVTIVYGRGEDGWEPRVRTLQYSLDFDPDYLLLANYIPIHTALLPRELFLKVGGFDEGLEYSEDWDFLIRLSAESPFRHLRAVTCEYRVFEPQSNDPGHAAAGAAAFQDSRRRIFERYAARRTDAALARALDRMRAQVAYWYDRDGMSQGELRSLREEQRRLSEALTRSEKDRRTEKARLTAENELVHARLAEAFAKNEEYDLLLQRANVEAERLNGILQQIYASRTWRLHLLLERLRGRR